MLKSEVQEELYIMEVQPPVSRVNLGDLRVYQICREGTTWYHDGEKIVSDGNQQSYHEVGMAIQTQKLQGRVWVPDTTFTPHATFDYDRYMSLDDYMSQCRNKYLDGQRAHLEMRQRRMIEVKLRDFGCPVTVTGNSVEFRDLNSIVDLLERIRPCQ